jgi:hypothetical protein
LIFGCGSDLEHEFDSLESEYEIVALFDKEKDLHGKFKFGIKIYPPEKIPDFSYDFIKICSLAHTNKIRSQIIDIGVQSEKIMPTPLFCDKNFQNWEKLKKQRKSKRIFIIGNGPSLNVCDLDLLHMHDELSFAFNKIYLAFDQTKYRPTYYMVEDILVAKNNAKRINSISKLPKFFPEFITRQLTFSDTDYIYGLNRPNNRIPVAKKPTLNFLNFGWGGAVTCTAIQVALYMGFKEIYLLGVDNSFRYENHNANKNHLVGAGESNHFHPEYRPIGEKWNPPYEKITNDHFTMLNKLSESIGSRIINCTRGGAVEVFTRKSLDDILS